MAKTASSSNASLRRDSLAWAIVTDTLLTMNDNYNNNYSLLWLIKSGL